MAVKVLFLLPYPLSRAPSQRFRVETYFELLQRNQIDFDINFFFDEKAWRILYKQGSFFQKLCSVIKGLLKSFSLILFRTGKYSYIFIHREAAPIGPPFFEWWLAKVLGKKLIYDFDDAIWIANVTESNKIARFVKCFWKVKWICKWSYKVSAGNHFLADYARQFNDNVVYNPTCVDTENRYNLIVDQQQSPLTIGWTGSHSTLQFLADALPVLKEFEKKHHFRFLVICDQKPNFDLKNMEFIPWNKETEIQDLSKINIGIMPLKSDAWSEGKCGFKIIQYLALGIPAVASPVGVNKEIIEHGQNGYVCATDKEWIEYLTELLENEEKRIFFGKKGREKIVREFSIASNASTFLSLFSD
jgi:glycosyltransferase involved in cell wall biosynthesis